MILPEGLLEILACPVDKGDLLYLADEDLLYNPRLRRAYRIEGGIPVLLAERAEPVPEREHERLCRRSRAPERMVEVSQQGGDLPASVDPDSGSQ
jgi:uncharacterized protein YbaR (Trm112 family)